MNCEKTQFFLNKKSHGLYSCWFRAGRVLKAARKKVADRKKGKKIGGKSKGRKRRGKVRSGGRRQRNKSRKRGRGLIDIRKKGKTGKSKKQGRKALVFFRYILFPAKSDYFI